MQPTRYLEKRFIKIFLVCLFTFLLFQNCGQMRGSSHSSSKKSLACKVQPLLPSPFDQEKVQISPDFLQGLNSQSVSENSADSQNLMDFKKELSLLVNPLCLNQSDKSITVLGTSVEIPSGSESLPSFAVTISFEEELDLEQLTQDIEQSPCLIGVSENETMTINSVDMDSTSLNDPLAENQKHLDFVNYSKSVELQNQITSSVVVAVVDTGIAEKQPDLKNRLWDDGQGHHGKNFSEDGESIYNIDDTVDHGTHIAGLIAAEQNNEKGVAGLNGSFVRIMAVKVFKGKTTNTTKTYNGILYAISKGVDVINLSLGSDKTAGNAIRQDALSRAINAGIVVTMAAGNSGKKLDESYCHYPSCFGSEVDGGISVGSVDTETEELSDFSNHSATFVEMAAPGAEAGESKGLISTKPHGCVPKGSDNCGWRYGRMWGTSMATPVVSAAAAFVIGYFKTKNKNYTPAAIEEFLKEKGAKKSQKIQPFVEEGRVIDFDFISQNLLKLFDNNNPGDNNPKNNDPGNCF